MINLSAGQCAPCRGGEPVLNVDQIDDLLFHVIGWRVIGVDGIQRLEKGFKFKDFTQAMDFASRVAAIADEQGHHPLMSVEWGRVTVQWWTHVIKGLHRNDFIMAAKTDVVFEGENKI